jgi:hypothetical protein
MADKIVAPNGLAGNRQVECVAYRDLRQILENDLLHLSQAISAALRGEQRLEETPHYLLGQLRARLERMARELEGKAREREEAPGSLTDSAADASAGLSTSFQDWFSEDEAKDRAIYDRSIGRTLYALGYVLEPWMNENMQRGWRTAAQLDRPGPPAPPSPPWETHLSLGGRGGQGGPADW